MKDASKRNIVSITANFIDRIFVWLSIVVGAALMVNMVVAVFYRYALNSPIYWADELSLYLFCWSAFLGGTLALKRSEMAAVTVILDRLPFKFKTIVLILIEFVVIFFVVVMGYYSILWIKSPSVMNLVVPTLHVKVWYLYLIVPVTMFAMLIFSIERIIRFISEWNSDSSKESSL